MQMARPSYLVNRWLTGVIRRYQDETTRLIRARDVRLAERLTPPGLLADQSLAALAHRGCNFGEVAFFPQGLIRVHVHAPVRRRLNG